jgi:uncharacterized phage protein gp47/JayE
MNVQKHSDNDTQGCCEASSPATPETVNNRPGLSTIRYRIGAYASFRQAMLEGISGCRLHVEDKQYRPLANWTTRDSDDYGIAILEMWAYLADILTFYQERIANEAFLGTARQLESLIRLAKMLHYKPAPGRAASAWLAFTAEDGASVKIPKELRVQSVPGQDAKPQKFETVESITAESWLNRVRILPKPELYNPLAQDSSEGLLVSNDEGLSAGDKLVVFDAIRIELKEVSALSVQDYQTTLRWSPPVQLPGFRPFTTQTAPYGRQFQLFGYNAPERYLEPKSADSSGIKWVLKKDYSFALPKLPATRFEEKTFQLDARYDDLKPGSRLLFVQGESSKGKSSSFARVAAIADVISESASFGPLQDTVTQVALDLSINSTPIVVRDAKDFLQVFTIGDDGALWTIKQLVLSAAPSRWGTWSSLGGQIDMLAVGQNQDGRLEVFARSLDKALWHIWQLTPGGNWSQWARRGGQQIDMLAVGQNEDGRLEVFARGLDKALWHIWQESFMGLISWSEWKSLGQQIDMLAVGKNQDGRLEVFARGPDKALWHIWQESFMGLISWSEWKSLGQQIDMLAVEENQDGRLEVFARGADKALWHIWQKSPNNGWSKWASLGGQIDMLAVGQNQGGRLEVFARGPDKTLCHIWQLTPGGNWSQWARRGGQQIDMLAVGQNQDGRLEVFARGLDKALWHIWQKFANNGWDTWKSLGLPFWPISDRRNVVVFELEKPFVPFWDRRYSKTITGNTVYVPLNKFSGLEARRALILDDRATNPQKVAVSATSTVDINNDGRPDFLAITLTSALKRSLDTETAVFYGNIAKATHGETIADEVLGSGDASASFQQFTVRKSPVTRVADPKATFGAANTLEVQVDGLRWREQDTFYGQDNKAMIYTTEVDEDGVMSVRFGDGITGARLITGRNNILTKYRQGMGKAGQVKAGALTNLLDRPKGLKGVTNPDDAWGAADPEDTDKIRENAPDKVRTFDRIVSLRDFEDAARLYSGVAKARAAWQSQPTGPIVSLTVAGDNGKQLSPAALKNLRNYLDARRDPNRLLILNSHREIRIAVKAVLHVDEDYSGDTVQNQAQQALQEHFAFANRDLGQAVHLSDIYQVLQAVDGVVGATINDLQYHDKESQCKAHGLDPKESPQMHLPIFTTELAAIKWEDITLLWESAS